MLPMMWQALSIRPCHQRVRGQAVGVQDVGVVLRDADTDVYSRGAAFAAHLAVMAQAESESKA
jgi:hypothetical protein